MPSMFDRNVNMPIKRRLAGANDPAVAVHHVGLRRPLRWANEVE
jgi:hypothetical protein